MNYNIDDYPELAERFSYVIWTYYCVKVPLQELQAIYSDNLNEEESKLINSDTFILLKVSHSYFLIMELCKLLEPYSRNRNFGSITYLSAKLKELFPNYHVELLKKNTTSLDKIKEDKIIKELRLLRNKKFAHSDNLYRANSFRFLSQNEILELSKHVNVLYEIIDSYYSTFFGKSIAMRGIYEDRTRNFIKNISEWSAVGREVIKKRRMLDHI